MRLRLTLQQLEAFTRLVEARSFREAAAAMGISQPSFSRTIQQIEGRLQVRLFDRDTRHVRLTSAGERLRPIALQLLRSYDQSFEEFETYLAGRAGRVKVATLPSVAATLLPAAVKRFQARHPAMDVEVWEAVGLPVHRVVSDGEADFGIAPPPLRTSGLNFRLLHRDPLVLVCQSDDPLAAVEQHDWAVLKGRPFIAMPADTGLRGLIDEALAEAGVEVTPRFTCYPQTAGAFVTASLGLTVLTRLTVELVRTPGFVWRHLRAPEAVRPIGIVTSPGRSLLAPVRDFMRQVEVEARSLGSD